MPLPQQFHRLRLPVIGAPMFIVSGLDLVEAQCRAGILGTFPALNARPQSEFAVWLEQLGERLAGTHSLYGVNLICHASNDRLSGDLETCMKFKVPLIITSLRPPAEVVQGAHAYGGLVFHDVTTVRHAEKAAEQGVDGLIVVCAGAGGHGGATSPFALLPEIRRFFPGTLILAGAIGDGAAILAAQAMGADLVYMGTRFIATREANAAPGYKQMIVDSGSKDVTYTNMFSGVHGNYLSKSMIAAGLDPANLPAPETGRTYVAGHKREKPKAWSEIWGAGQGAGAITDTPPVATLIQRMEAEYRAAADRLATLAGAPSRIGIQVPDLGAGM
ncbi:MAG: nitronate monooxygenase [Acetobacteraceae bacterium]|nr:nitronate monooxygenase [Acetobacteraceae bacterium]